MIGLSMSAEIRSAFFLNMFRNATVKEILINLFFFIILRWIILETV